MHPKPISGLSITTLNGIIVPMSGEFILAPSILAADLTRLGDAIREAEAGGADWIHIDVMDGHFVPNLTMGPLIVEACRRATSLPLHVHLMVESPERMVADFARAGADGLTVHIEASPHLHRTLEAIHRLGKRAGVALNPATPAVLLSEAMTDLDLVLVMTVDPGSSGQAFLRPVLSKLRAIREMIRTSGSQAKIAVDGGVSALTAPEAAQAGAQIFVAASAIFDHAQGIRAGLEELRRSLERFVEA